MSYSLPYNPTLGLVADPNRSVKPGREYNKYFTGTLQGNNPILTPRGSVFDTLNHMKKVAEMFSADTKRIAPVLKAGELETTLRNIWNFVFDHISYEQDKNGVEQIRRPLRMWKDRKGDCDCYSVFISTVLSNLKIPHYFRMTDNFGNGWNHVYVVVPKSPKSSMKTRSGYFVLDPVVSEFNYEEPFKKKHDVLMTPIQLLNGLGNVQGLAGIASLGFGSEFDSIGTLSGLGSPISIEQEFLIRLKKHLMNTREIIQANAVAFTQSSGLNAATFLSRINFLLQNFDNASAREQALESLARIEAAEGLSGLDGFFKKLGEGIKKVSQTVASGVKQGASKVGGAIKQVGQGIVRISPLTVLIRTGLLAAMRLNWPGRIAEKLGYAYYTEQQIRDLGFDLGEWRKIKEKLKKVENIFNGLQGNPVNLRNQILIGHKKGAEKMGYPYLKNLQGLGTLGEPVTAASTAAASGTIAKIVSLLKDVDVEKWAKKAKQAKQIADDAKSVSDTVKSFVPEKEVSTSPVSSTPSTTYTPSVIDTNSAIPRDPVLDVAQRSSDATPEPETKSNAAMIAIISVASAAALGGTIYALTRKKKSSKTLSGNTSPGAKGSTGKSRTGKRPIPSKPAAKRKATPRPKKRPAKRKAVKTVTM